MPTVAATTPISNGQTTRPSGTRSSMRRRGQRQNAKQFSHSSSSSSLANSVGAGNGSNAASSGDEQTSGGTNGGDQQQKSMRLADYDEIRNKTVMFFLDRLYYDSREGKEVRTLHDLSCLFGTKEFTREMRQIVGGSRNGLKKLFESYPSLFTVEDDKVYLSQFKTNADTSKSQTRDYNREAVEYFSKKLQQFGQSMVPIRYLFGYRSQASQEVRHVSGRSGKEFKEFLRENSDVFELVNEENVILKSVFSNQSEQLDSLGPLNFDEPQSFLSLQCFDQQQQQQQNQQAMDPYLNKRVAQFIQKCLSSRKQHSEADEHVSIEQLHELMMSQGAEQDSTSESQSLYAKLISNVQDLRMMLRMHPKLFKRYKRESEDKEAEVECVRLLTESELSELLASTGPSQPSKAQQLVPADPTEAEAARDQFSLPSSYHSQQPLSLPPETSSRDQVPREESGSKPKSALRADASTFIPASHLRKQLEQQQLEQQMNVTKSGKNSRSGPSSISNKQQEKTKRSNLSSPVADVQQGKSAISQDSRQSLRSYLIKATAANQSTGLYNPSKLSNGAQEQPPSLHPEEEAKARTISILREASSIVGRIMSTNDPVAFDCKGYNLGLNGQITLVQFAFLPASGEDANEQAPQIDMSGRKPEVCLFDLITNPELAYVMKPLLESEKNVKIIHDVRNKSNALFVQFGIVLKNVFDTQVANLVIQQQETGRPAYKSRYRSISKLCEIYGDQALNKYRALIKTKTRHNASSPQNDTPGSGGKTTKDVNYWRVRPLTDAMVYESTMDVYCLIGGVYQQLKAQIRKEYEPLFEQLNHECVFARIKPDEIRNVKKERKIELEVIDLKHKLYSLNGPIVLSNREIRLLRHIDLTEEVRAKIQHCKKVEKKLERLDMKAAAKLEQEAELDGSSGNAQSLRSESSGNNSDFESNGNGAHLGGSSLASCQQDFDPETDLPNLIDGSMFDEIKTRMIETSTLLKSLDEEYKDDNDMNDLGHDEIHHRKHQQLDSQQEQEAAERRLDSLLPDCVSLSLATTATSGPPSHHTDQEDSCSCRCHRSSINSNEHTRSNPSSLSTQASQTEPISCPENFAQVDQEKQQPGSGSDESLKVDMAVQCDLISESKPDE